MWIVETLPNHQPWCHARLAPMHQMMCQPLILCQIDPREDEICQQIFWQRNIIAWFSNWELDDVIGSWFGEWNQSILQEVKKEIYKERLKSSQSSWPTSYYLTDWIQFFSRLEDLASYQWMSWLGHDWGAPTKGDIC